MVALMVLLHFVQIIALRRFISSVGVYIITFIFIRRCCGAALQRSIISLCCGGRRFVVQVLITVSHEETTLALSLWFVLYHGEENNTNDGIHVEFYEDTL